MKRRRLFRPSQPPVSGFAGFRFPPEIILIGVRWYLRYGLSYRDLEELLAERGIEVDHVSLYVGFSPWMRCDSCSLSGLTYRLPADPRLGIILTKTRDLVRACPRRSGGS